jgi:hypothetical protein
MCTKNKTKIHHKRAQEGRDWIDSKSPEGTRRMGPPFPIKSNTKSHESINKSYSKEKNRERDTGAAAWEEQAIHGQNTKAAL